jgi:hypothetical protein
LKVYFLIVLVVMYGVVYLIDRSSATKPSRGSLCLAFGITLVLFKLWLVSWQDLIAIGGGRHDDFLFLRLAAFISEGDWLGPYDELTLVKGPFYSIWMSCMHWIGVPLLFANQVLYVLASIVAAVAWRPIIKSNWLLMTIFIVVLFNPMTFSLGHIARVDRFGIYPAQALLVHACAIGFLLRISEMPIRYYGWALSTGIALGLILITREASIWLLPGLVIIAFIVMLFPKFKYEGINRKRVLPLALIAFLGIIPSQLVSYLNWTHYGYWGVTEFGGSRFSDAYGALSRIKPISENVRIPVSTQARKEAYKVSPSFAVLQVHLEGGIGYGWSSLSSAELGENLDGEIAGGWFMWALRDASTQRGMHRRYGAAETFYGQIADEVNAACDQGILECLPFRVGFVPVWNSANLLPTLEVYAEAWLSTMKFSQYRPESAESFGQGEILDMFRDYTGEKLSINNQEKPPTESYVQKQREAERALGKIQRTYKKWVPVTFLLLFCGFLYRCAKWNRVTNSDKLLILSGIVVFGNMSAYAAMLSYIEVTSFFTLSRQYLFPNHALLCWLIGIGFAYLLMIFAGRYSGSKMPVLRWRHYVVSQR